MKINKLFMKDIIKRFNFVKVANKFVEELNSNYKKVEGSTDFKFYDYSEVKVFAKDLKEYNGTTLEYVGIMPKIKTLSEFIKNSNAKSLNDIVGKLKSIELNSFEDGKITRITGGIPLFKYNYSLDLKGDLIKLGITDIFTKGKSDLSGIIKNTSSIVEVAHKADIEFSNECIKATAATTAGGCGASGCQFEHLYDVPVVEIDLTFNNPYLYIIRNKNTGEVWFTGTVYEPIENSSSVRIINENNSYKLIK